MWHLMGLLPKYHLLDEEFSSPWWYWCYWVLKGPKIDPMCWIPIVYQYTVLVLVISFTPKLYAYCKLCTWFYMCVQVIKCDLNSYILFLPSLAVLQGIVGKWVLLGTSFCSNWSSFHGCLRNKRVLPSGWWWRRLSLVIQASCYLSSGPSRHTWKLAFTSLHRYSLWIMIQVIKSM